MQLKDQQKSRYEGAATTGRCWRPRNDGLRTRPPYLFVEVEEAFGAVDVVKGGEGLDGSIDGHGVKPQPSSRGDQHPVGGRATDEHLRQKHMYQKDRELNLLGKFQMELGLYPRVSRDVLKVPEPGNPALHSHVFLRTSALRLLVLLQLGFLLSEVNAVGYLSRRRDTVRRFAGSRSCFTPDSPF